MRRYLVILIIPLFIQCFESYCNENKNLFVNNECIVILKKDLASAFTKGGILKIDGFNPETGEYCKCQDTGRMWGMFQSYMEKGDTFVKRKGEDFFTIHKKDTVFRIEWVDCDEDNEYIIPNNPPQDYNKVKRH